MKREALPEDRRKIEYRLTEKGFALLPAMLALRQWGETYETGTPAWPVLVDARDRRPIAPITVRAWDGRVLGHEDLMWSLPEDVVGYEPPAQAAE